MTTRITKKRQAILDVLQESDEALSAAEVHAKLSTIDLATVYRNLEYFTKEKVIKKLMFGGHEARFEYQDEPHHHAICSECERVIHFMAPEEKLIKLLGIEDFQVDEIEVTVRGICNHT
jgi:Fur family ferric uptake transcriptional regulator